MQKACRACVSQQNLTQDRNSSLFSLNEVVYTYLSPIFSYTCLLSAKLGPSDSHWKRSTSYTTHLQTFRFRQTIIWMFADKNWPPCNSVPRVIRVRKWNVKATLSTINQQRIKTKPGFWCWQETRHIRLQELLILRKVTANPYPSWVQSRRGLPTARPLLLSRKGHSCGDRYGDVTSSLYI